jgi:hypothetical protein
MFNCGCIVSHTCFVFARFSVSVLARKVVCRIEIFIDLPTKYPDRVFNFAHHGPSH